MNEKQDIQVFGVSRDGSQITGSTTLEELLTSCEVSIPVSDVHVLIMDNGNVASRKIGRIGLQFVPEQELFTGGQEASGQIQAEPQLDTTLDIEEPPTLKIKPLKPAKRKRGRPRKVKNE